MVTNISSAKTALPSFITAQINNKRTELFNSLDIKSANNGVITLSGDELNEVIKKICSSLLISAADCKYHIHRSDDDLIHALYFLAAKSQGYVYVPVNPAADINAIKEVFNTIHGVVFTDDEESVISVISPVSNNYSSPANPVENTDTTAQDLLIIFTSGSTGKPKGVVHKITSLVSSFNQQSSVYGYHPSFSWLSSLPAFHIGGMSVITRAAFSGAGLYFPLSRKKEDILAAVNLFRPAFFSLVPTQLKQFVEARFSPYPELKNIFAGGGPADDSLLQSASALMLPVIKCYGSSETASYITALGPEEYKLRPDSAGKAIPGVELFIKTDNKIHHNPGIHGEVVLKSPSLFREYINEPEQTAQRLQNELYFTGDEGYLDSEGYLFLSGRKSRIIVTGGENVAASEIERKLETLQGVRGAIVFGIEDPHWGEKIVAAVEVEDAGLTEASIKDYLKTQLPSFKIPKVINVYNKFPQNELGKTNLQQIKQDFIIH